MILYDWSFQIIFWNKPWVSLIRMCTGSITVKEAFKKLQIIPELNEWLFHIILQNWVWSESIWTCSGGVTVKEVLNTSENMQTLASREITSSIRYCNLYVYNCFVRVKSHRKLRTFHERCHVQFNAGAVKNYVMCKIFYVKLWSGMR